MRQLGEILNIYEAKDNCMIRIISKKKYDKRIFFNPLEYNFFSDSVHNVWVDFDNNENYKIREFDFLKDKDLLDYEFIRAKGISFSFTSNNYINKIIIDNQLYGKGRFEELERLKSMIDRVDHFHMTPVKLLNSIDISELVKEYEISYQEEGWDKPGDKSSARIAVSTDRPYPLDNYIKKLLPKFDLTITSGSDFDYNCLWSSEILSKMENEIGKDKIESIKNVCIELTNSIQKMALLLYNETEHAESLRREYHDEYSRILKSLPC